jgi:hypothetical protein
MNEQVHIPTKPTAAPERHLAPATFGTLQRKCACGGSGGSGGDCAECAKKKLQRRANGGTQSAPIPPTVHEVLRSPGKPLDSSTQNSMASRFSFLRDQPLRSIARSASPAALAVNQPGDRYEQEADQVADRVMRRAGTASMPAANTFSNVRIHNDPRAAESARSVGALAYTVGNNVVFGAGQYSPATSSGQRLLAHELTHTLQQGGDNRLVMGTWDKAEADCPASQNQKWIDKIVVKQDAPLGVTIHWSDGSTETDECSTGKGHCCVDDKNPNGIACTLAQSQTDGSNCTPITQHMGFHVQNRVRDHKGINFWTEFVPARAIALHEYSPIDKDTPLSHGCVRLHTDMAKKIFCNVRQDQTWVQVQGFARPKCGNAKLQQEWLDDFKKGGQDLSKADGDEKANIQETRRELNAAFGPTLTPDEMNKFTAADIPRCSRTAPLPNPPSQQQPGSSQGKPGSGGGQ